jgi:glycosyltransferase involved in cell wall biosynthesis
MLSLVIPVYRNETSLPRLLQELGALAPKLPGGLEVVFVVDGSPDDSLRILRERLPAWGVNSRLVELSRNFGAFPAIAAGLQEGTGDYFAVMAADLQEPPELMLAFQALMAEGNEAGKADIVLGERQRRDDPFLTKAASLTFWKFFRRFVMRDMPVGGVDVFGCTRAVRDRLVAMREVNTSLVGLLLWLGYRRALVPYERRAREEGRSGWTLQKKWRYALDSVFSFSDLPIRVLLVLGGVATVGAIVADVVILVCWLMGLIPVLGYTPLMLTITTFGGLTALGLGIVGQYLWLALQNTRNRPSYVVRSVQQFDRTTHN